MVPGCGYRDHVEACHVQDISSFPPGATLDQINDPSNLRLLCRNHHWEFDHGLLILDDTIHGETEFLADLPDDLPTQ